MRLLAFTVALSLPVVAKIDFATEIQPILSNNCYACHGPDETKAESELRLDQRELAIQGGDSGPALVPGDAKISLLFQRITSSDEDEHMPPLEKKDPLTPEQISLIEAWINEGAEWGTHWAFETPTRPALPEVKNPVWVQTPIDQFILATLEKEGLSPSKKADPRTLMRRLSLDLTGLPPTLEQLSKADSTVPGKFITQLISSPHFGEKWGRDWLDVARYADSAGYEKDLPRYMHFYRDWVVKAHNEDMPFDDFIIKQIAGDLLPSATQDDIIATGYLRNSMSNEEGGAKPEQFRVEGIFDRMDAVGKGILGLTTQCAQCHTHKYDPLTHDEYFGMFAFLNTISEASHPAFNQSQHRTAADLKKEITAIETEAKNATADWQTRFQKWQDDLQSLPYTEWVTQSISQIGDDGQKYQNLPDGSLINQGYAATMMDAPFTGETEMADARSVRIELLNHPYLSLNGPGRSLAGTAALSEYKLQAGPDANSLKSVKFVKATASVNPPDAKLNPMLYPLNHKRSKDDRITGRADYAIDGSNKTAWTTDQGPGRSNVPQVITFEMAEPLANPGKLILRTQLGQRHGGWNSDDNQTFNIGRFRLSFAKTLPNALDHLPPLVKEALLSKQRTAEQKTLLFSHWLKSQPDLVAFTDRIEQVWRKHPKPTPALVASKVAQPRVTRLFDRGEQSQPKHIVKPHVPEFLHPLPEGDSSSRLTFAKWLVDAKSPLTARTFVNRIWQGYFGKGLVETTEDLGLQSPRPSHPELLDWLAVEFMENDWSMKHLHRLIVSSATYQQLSRHESLLSQRDPYNRLIARGPRLRVKAETIRDIHLSASGLIHHQVGGRAVFPPAPDFLFQKPSSYGPKIWFTEQDEQRYRRALYTFRFRSVPYPMLVAFDAPTGDAACVRRTVSTTPLQALVTLNEEMSVEAAVALGHLILKDGKDFAKAFERCTSRVPNEQETQILAQLFEQQRKAYLQDKDSAKTLIDTYKPISVDITQHDPVDLAAATAVAQALLNLDETISKN
ncbi:MAG: PSD1 and planctomycete cytochrome C domain-containing protein [Akkermansiaceae bacterium]